MRKKGDVDFRRVRRVQDQACALVDRRVLVRRFNGLIQVLTAPEPRARRLARRLARDRAATITRALARTPRHPWRTPPPADALVRASQALLEPEKGADDG
jgi:hypothetical protein